MAKRMEHRGTATPAQSQTGSGKRVRAVRLWLNAFIPADVEGAEPVPAGPHAGKTMFRSPGPLDAWFLTDQRGFSSDVHAHARMHSEIELDFVTMVVTREHHKCDPTIQVDHKTGAEDCHETAESDDIHFSDVEIAQDPKRFTMHLHGSSKNACLRVGPIPVSPATDYDGDIEVRLSANGREVTVVFEGDIEDYPAFEMYVSVDDGHPVPLFQAPVEPGAGPTALIGPGKRHLQKSATVTI